MTRVFSAWLLFLLLPAWSPAQTAVDAFSARVLAGRGSSPIVRDGVGEDARFEAITAMWGDGSNLYVSDTTRLRRIELSTSVVTTLSRSASSGARRTAASSGFSYDYGGLYGLWGEGTALFGTDIGDGSIRRIDLTTGGVQVVSEGLGFPWGLAGGAGKLYVAIAQAGQVKQVDTGSGVATDMVTTGTGTPRECFLGSGCLGYFVPGPRSAWSDDQYLYLTGYSGTVKRVHIESREQTFLPAVPFNIGPIAGVSGRLFVAETRGAHLGSLQLDTGEFTPIPLPPDNLVISALWSDGASLFLAQGTYLKAQVIRRVDLATSEITTIAGVPQVPEFADGNGTAARFHAPEGIWGDGVSLYVADRSNFTIRKINASDAAVTTLVGSPARSTLQDGVGTNAGLSNPRGIWGDGTTLYITDSHAIRSVSLSTGRVTTIAGSSTPGAVNGAGLAARFSNPTGLWGKDGVLYIADHDNRVIRQLTLATGEVRTWAGALLTPGVVDGNLETARFQIPTALWSSGDTLYVLDDNRVRAISFDSGSVRTVGSLPSFGFGLWGLDDFLYTLVAVPASAQYCLYRIATATGEVSQVVHGADPSEGLPMLSPGAGQIWGGRGDLFITDNEDNTVRRLTRVTAPPFARFEIDNPGFSKTTTPGAPATISITHTRLSANPDSVTPAAFAIYGLRRSGTLVSEASVLAAHPIQSGRISATATGGANTGIAVANPNPAPTVIEFYFTDSTGRDFGRSSFTLNAGAQLARFITDSPFNGPTPIDGTITFLSTLPVSVIAVHGYVNERSEFLMATLPVVDLSPSERSSLPVVVPHFVMGSGWTTELTLVNPTDQQISGSLQFVGAVPNGPFLSNYAVPGRSSQRFQLAYPGGVTSGSVLVTPGIGFAPSAVAVFSFSRDDMRIAEGGVPDVPVASAFRFYGESNGSPSSVAPGTVRSSVSIMNTSSTPVDVTVEIADPDVAYPPLIHKATLHIEGMQRIFRYMDQVLVNAGPHLFRISAPAPVISVVSVRSRYNERGDLLMTPTPAIPESTILDHDRLYIPHVIDGGGFTTEIILFSSTSQSIGTMESVTTEHFDQNGTRTLLPIR